MSANQVKINLGSHQQYLIGIAWQNDTHEETTINES